MESAAILQQSDRLWSTPADKSTAPIPAAASSERSKAITYRPEIDGLRAIAVIPVILFHLGIPGFRGGNLGVDVFFVISGFLITSIVKRESDAGTFSFAKFWARRVRRITPAMLAVTIASLLFGFFFLYLPDQPAVGTQAAWSLLSSANIYFWKFVGSYWGMAASQSPFLHMWSLAVEEQFYLFMPIAVWLIYKFSRQLLLPVTLLVMLASFGLFAFYVGRNPQASFYLLPTRAWELAAGCALAAVQLPSRQVMWLKIAAGLGLAMIVASYFVVTTFGLGNTLPVLGAVLVLAFGQSGFSYKILSNRVTVFIGQISYSLYLWHWPVIVFPGYLDWHPSKMLLVVVATGLALVSYYFIEKPTRHARYTVPVSLAGLLITCLFASVMGAHHRFYDTSAFKEPVLYIRSYDCNPTPPPIDETWTGMKILPSTMGPKDYLSGGLLTGKSTPEVVVLGDSHATFWAPIVRRYTDKYELPASFWLMSGVDPFFSTPPHHRGTPWFLSSEAMYAYDEARIRLLAQWKPKIIFVATRWSVRSQKGTEEFVNYLCNNAGHVFLIEQAPELPIGNRNSMQYLAYKGYVPKDGVKQYYSAANRDGVRRGSDLIRQLAAAHTNCSVVPTKDLYENGDSTIVLDGRQVIYMDDDHLTDYGASLAGARIEAAIQSVEGLNANK